MQKRKLLCAVLAILFSTGVFLVELAHARIRVNGQTLYVPAYSYIYHGNKNAKLNVTTTLSVRNTSRTQELRIVKVEYYNTEGKLLRSYLKEPITMTPLQSLRYIVNLDDDSGGSGANFIITWEADQAIDAPIVETIMLGTGASFGFAFLTDAVEIE